MSGMNRGLRESCEIVLNQCLAIKPGEIVLIITDAPLRTIGYAFFEEAKKMESEAIFVEIVERREQGAEPPSAVAQLMKNVDVVVAPTSKSLTHTSARLAASRAGVRIATLPGVTQDMLLRAIKIDYIKLNKVTRQLAKLLSQAKTARLTCPRGTDLTMNLEGREGRPDTGIIHESGAFSNLPAGEAFIAPVEGTSEGKIETAGKPGQNIAELGIGTNPKAIISGEVLEDEKVLGTVHIAIGDNKNFGGKVKAPYHLDGMILEPTLWLNGKKFSKTRNFV